MDFKLLKNIWAIRLLWALGVLLVVWSLAWSLVPVVVKIQVEKLFSEQLGRKVTLGHIDFEPWSLALTVHDFAVARAQGVVDSSPQLSVKRFSIDAELESLLRLAPVIDAIELSVPHLSLSYFGEGHYDVDDILTRLGKSSGSPEGAALRFALYNLVLSNGSLDFYDKTTGKAHALRDLQIQLPFLSNLDSQRAVLVEPKLGFKLNGSRFDSAAQATPFAQTHKADATLKFTDLDLTPYLDYVPATLPVKLSSAVLNADLKVSFEQAPKMAVRLSGSVQAVKVKIVKTERSAASLKYANPPSSELLDFDLLTLTLGDIRPLERVVRLAAVTLEGPRLQVHRSKSGQLNLALASTSVSGSKNIALDVGATRTYAANDDKNGLWQLSVDKFVMRGGAVNWVDELTVPAAVVGLQSLNLEASGFALPWVQPVELAGSTQLSSGANALFQKSDRTGRVDFKGRASDVAAELRVQVADIPLGLAQPYLAQFMSPTLGGIFSAEFGVNWKARSDRRLASALVLDVERLTLDEVSLLQGKTSVASFRQFQVAQAQVDFAGQTATLGKLSVIQPKVMLAREADGRWMFESWMKTGSTTPVARAEVKATSEKSWGVVLQDVALQGGALSFVDKTVGKPVAFDLSSLSVQLKNYVSSGLKPFDVNVSAQMRAGEATAGRLAWRGRVGLSPLTVAGQVEALRIPIHAIEPYLAQAWNLDLVRADASFKGQVNFAQTAAGPVLKVSGDTTIEDFQANTGSVAPDEAARVSVSAQGGAADSLNTGEELLSWKLLSLRGLDVAVAPGTATQVAIAETVLSEFFARLILSEAGRLNLQDVMKAPVAEPTLAESRIATENIAINVAPTGTLVQNGSNLVLAPVISFGPIGLANGRVHFSDRFIRPNYSANLTQLNGQLSAFSSVSPAGTINLADLVLKGRAEGTASLEILGKVNPLVSPVALDIKGRVRDLELPALSPYAVRHTGYGIERGKLSVDVGYQVQPDGQLTASNNIVLKQLSFGDKVDGAPASLPVKLAVALLADRQGVIDINLPVSGSLNDPQFKLAPIVFKLVLNLIAKAITAPFSLLANVLGGGSDELSVVSFAPGSAELRSEAKTGLDKVAQALLERPALKMTVVGAASLEMERDAFKREQLQSLIRAEKRRMVVTHSLPAGLVVPGEEGEAVTAAEYPVLLAGVYRRADMAKPRNLVGMVKDISVQDMEDLLLARLTATDDAMRELAVSRGVKVRDYLALQQIPLERLFLGAAKSASSDAKWSPRAELNLATE